MPLVSVIVPIYKVEKYIDKCVTSLLNQTERDVEIILVNDGSPDRCGAICEQYAKADGRILVVHKENGGLSDARNTGIARASGKYLLFVDGDDFVSKTLVEKTVECAEKMDADLVLFDYQEIEEDSKRKDHRSLGLPAGEILNAKKNPELLLTTPTAWNKLYKREFWQKAEVSYPVGRNFEDLAVTPKLLLEARRVVYLESEPLYHYILREGSIIRSDNFKRSYENRKAAVEDVLEFFRQQNEWKRYEKELEYLVFEHMYFVPSKEIILKDSQSPYLNEFRNYLESQFPEWRKNRYIKERLSYKDKILLFLLKKKWYGMMNVLSSLRKKLDQKKN